MAKAPKKPKKAKAPKGKRKESTRFADTQVEIAEKQPKLRRAKKSDTTGPQLPKVNLLPPGLVLVVLRARLRRTFSLIAVVILTLAAVVFVAQSTTTQLAKSDLAIATVQREAAKDTVSKYLPIADFYESLKQRIELAQKAFAESIDYSSVINDIRVATPSGITFTKIEVGVGNGREDRRTVIAAGGVLNCGPNESPFAPTNSVNPAGCVIFEGTASSVAAVGALTDQLKKAASLSEVFVKPTDTGVGITFKGYASIKPELSLEKESYAYATSLGYDLVKDKK